MGRHRTIGVAAALGLGLGAGGLAGCGSGDSPVLEADGTSVPAGDATTSTAPSTTASAAPSELQTLALVLEGPGGTVEATLTYDGDELCLAGTSTGIGSIDDGHVHAGLVGESGPVVVDLGIRTDGDGPFQGCATVGAEGGVVLVDPASYYVDLHTDAHPDGAVRAQLG